ncbi:low affinity immunoglobulin gamma Fc region receptor II-like, partial [Anabas testudineus]|uniref:low affinity immunoglobulin gamma Fc region receptor II-like n=1 Tax=Anabas testudineus TaxID=64144 RepID=UPI00143D6D65
MWLIHLKLFNVLMLVANVHNYAEGDAFAWIIPSRLQLFDYGSISFNCESSNSTTEWKVFRRLKGEVGMCVSNWETTAHSVCAIKPVYLSDSGEYWCQTTGGKKSNTVNITVTDGSVILESPVLPVLEGEAVTLRCRIKKTSSAHMADFYKDGLFIGTGSFGEMTIKKVFKFHEGLYKCSIYDFGESPESRLSVRRAVHTETDVPSDHSCHTYLILRTVFTIVMVALLLLLVGLLHC